MRRTNRTAAVLTAADNGAPGVDTALVADATAATATVTAPPAPDTSARDEKRARDKAVRESAVRLYAAIAGNGLDLALSDAVCATARRTAGKDIRTGATSARQDTILRTARVLLEEAGGCPAVSRLLADAATALTLPGATIPGGYTAGAVAGAFIGCTDTVQTIRRAIQGK